MVAQSQQFPNFHSNHAAQNIVKNQLYMKNNNNGNENIVLNSIDHYTLKKAVEYDSFIKSP